MEKRLARRKALIAGATGLVGECLLRRLLAHPDYAVVEVLLRRNLAMSHPKLVQHVVDFEQLDSGAVAKTDDLFCCLGTTIGKAGSQSAFRRVDHDYPVALAQLAKAEGVQQFLLVSALGADAGSGVFYSRVKGETERDISAIGLPKAIFLRPSLLLGKRSERRAGERAAMLAGRLVAPLLFGRLRKYRPIDADDVAAAMVFAATHELASGPIESDQIARLAKRAHETS